MSKLIAKISNDKLKTNQLIKGDVAVGEGEVTEIRTGDDGMAKGINVSHVNMKADRNWTCASAVAGVLITVSDNGDGTSTIEAIGKQRCGFKEGKAFKAQ